MVYESFFDNKLQQAKNGLGKENMVPDLFMRIGAAAMDQAVGMRNYTQGFRPFIDTDIKTDKNIVTTMDTDMGFPAQGWLIWLLHDYLLNQMGAEQLEGYMCRLARLAWEETDKAGNICYILPFLAYYESRWNGRKGYGELIALVKESAEFNFSLETVMTNSKVSLGSLMTAVVQCYDEMTEEAYDQREVFADLLREYARVFQNCLEIQQVNSSRGYIQAAYALLKGIRLGILHHEIYGETAKIILTVMETEGFTFKNGIFCLKEEEEETSCEKAMYCMMAYGEYIKLRKERPYYGI